MNKIITQGDSPELNMRFCSSAAPEFLNVRTYLCSPCRFAVRLLERPLRDVSDIRVKRVPNYFSYTVLTTPPLHSGKWRANFCKTFSQNRRTTGWETLFRNGIVFVRASYDRRSVRPRARRTLRFNYCYCYYRSNVIFNWKPVRRPITGDTSPRDDLCFDAR